MDTKSLPLPVKLQVFKGMAGYLGHEKSHSGEPERLYDCLPLKKIFIREG